MKMLSLALPLLLAGCMTANAALQEGPARLGQTVSVGGPTVKPLAIVEDSRCPADVVCVWAGRVIVRAEVRTGQGTKEMQLTLGEPVQVADGQLTLRQVIPGKTSGGAINPGTYRFVFEFAGGL